MKHDDYRDEEISSYFICKFSTLIWVYNVLVMPHHQFNIEHDIPLILCPFCHFSASLTPKLINHNWYDYFCCFHFISSISPFFLRGTDAFPCLSCALKMILLLQYYYHYKLKIQIICISVCLYMLVNHLPY